MLNDKVGSIRPMFLKSNLYIITQVYFIKFQICNILSFSQLLPYWIEEIFEVSKRYVSRSTKSYSAPLHSCYCALWQMLNTK